MSRNGGHGMDEELLAAAGRIVAGLAGDRREAQEGAGAGLKSILSGLAESLGAGAAGSAGSASEPGALRRTVQALETAAQRTAGPAGWLSFINPVLGLLRLFGGGASKEAPVELPKYQRPERQHFLGGISASTGWDIRAMDYGAGWRAREIEGERVAVAPQVTVHVQAMDSRSFLDRRDEIAAAVRQALLESHSLMDVMSER